MGDDLPPALVAAPRVDRDDDALRAVLLRGGVHEIGIVHRRGVERHLVGARPQHAAGVLDRADSPADGERDEHLLGDLLDDVQRRVASVARRGDVEEHELVGAFRVVTRRELDRIAGVADADEVDALDDAARVDVEARDHADGEHAAIPSSTVNRFS